MRMHITTTDGKDWLSDTRNSTMEDELEAILGCFGSGKSLYYMDVMGKTVFFNPANIVTMTPTE